MGYNKARTPQGNYGPPAPLPKPGWGGSMNAAQAPGAAVPVTANIDRLIEEINERGVVEALKPGYGQDKSPFVEAAEREAEEMVLLGRAVPEGWVEKRSRELYNEEKDERKPQAPDTPPLFKPWYPGSVIEEMLKYAASSMHKDYHKLLSRGITKEQEEKIKAEMKTEYEAEIKGRLDELYSKKTAALLKSFMMFASSCLVAVFFNLLPEYWKMIGLLPLSYVFWNGWKMHGEFEKMMKEIKEETKVQ